MNQMTPDQLEQMQEIERVKKIIMRKILTKEAIERLGRIKLVKSDLATQLELYLVQLHQAGQIKGVIDDEQLKKILNSLTSKKDFKIRR